MKSLLITILSLTILMGGISYATPVQWQGNGHFYEAFLVVGGISWDEAQTTAIAAGGYLASITSAEENAFVFSLVSGNPNFWAIDSANNGIGPWLGGFQPEGSPEPDGNWQWVTGESFSYTNWAPLEPNNINGENKLILFGYKTLIADTWNDYPPTSQPGEPIPQGYIVESVPEPASILLLGAGLAGMGLFRRRINE